MKLLSLDQASHTTGYAIFEDRKPIVISHFNAKGKDIAERLVNIRQTILKLIADNEIDMVAFEDIQLQNNVVQNVKTFKMLAEVFGVVQETLQEIGIEYYIIPPMVWKSTIGIAGKGREREKPLAQKWVMENYNMKCTEDEADAACLGAHVIKKADSEFDWA